MSDEKGFYRKYRIYWLPFLLVLQACQSSTPSDVLAIAPGAATSAAPQSTPTNSEIIGQGPSRLAIIVATDSISPNEIRDIRNGAALALKDLDAGNLSIELLPISGADVAINEKAVGAFVTGAAAIAYAGAAPSSGVGASILQISLLPNGSTRPTGSLAFLPSNLDSLEGGINVSLANGNKGVSVFSPIGQTNNSLKAMIERLRSTTPVELIEYSSSESADLIALKATGKQSATFAFTGNGQEIAAIVAAVRAKLGPQARMQVIGNGSWQKSSLLSAPSLEGAIVAAPDFSNENVISANYAKEYGSSPSASSLYAYDLVAILSGIARVKGRAGLTYDAIRSKAGFRGVTGAFRFRNDGTVDRLFSIQQLHAGNLTAVSGAQSGF